MKDFRRFGFSGGWLLASAAMLVFAEASLQASEGCCNECFEFRCYKIAGQCHLVDKTTSSRRVDFRWALTCIGGEQEFGAEVLNHREAAGCM